MSSLTDLKTGDVVGILLTIFIAGFAFYFALVLSEAITLTVTSILPNSDSEVVTAWINFFVAVLIVAISVYFIVVYFARKRENINLQKIEIV